MKSFECELKGLRPGADWTYATVYYENTPKGAFICAIYDEFGNHWSLDDLASFDRELIEKKLVLECAADDTLSQIAADENISEAFRNTLRSLIL